MRKTAIFNINGEKKELLLFKKGDRVKAFDDKTTAINAEGTVEGTRSGGLFVDINWDKEEYPSKLGGQVKLGKAWMMDSLILINH